MKIHELLDSLKIEYKDHGYRISFACPFHGSDNPSSLSILVESGVWKCWSRGCHAQYPVGINGLTQAFKELTDKDHNIEISNATYIKRSVNINHDRFNYRGRVIIPPEFYLKRGYSTQILNKYDVGYNTFTNNIIVPVYDNDYEKINGYLYRTLNNKCELCNKYHAGNCDTPGTHAKWINSKGFPIGQFLYNFWFAKSYIQLYREAILVEGCGDVWRLEEAGIHNSVGLFGLELTRDRLSLLKQSGVYKIILALDADNAGQNKVKILKDKLKNDFIVDIYKPIAKDIGDMNIEDLKKDLCKQ